MSYRVNDSLAFRALVEFENYQVKSVDPMHPEAHKTKKGAKQSSTEAAIYMTYNFSPKFAIDVKLASGLSDDESELSLEPHFYYHFNNDLSIKGYASPDFDIFGFGVNYNF